jgi:hypothetical protein
MHNVKALPCTAGLRIIKDGTKCYVSSPKLYPAVHLVLRFQCVCVCVGGGGAECNKRSSDFAAT